MSDLAETLLWLVEIPSETGNESRICTDVAERLYPSVGRDGLDRIGNSLIAGHRTGRPVIVLAGHLDTVPAQGKNPARIEGGRLQGLGAADMKAGLTVMIHLIEDIELQAGPYDVLAVFYSGEEGPSAGNELEDVLSKATWLTQAEFAVVLEPSDGELQIGCNGMINAAVRFTGRSAHSARPWLGENAVTKAGDWLAEMHKRQPEPVEIEGLVYREVMTITRASGGVANNIIPSSFELNLNYRFAPTRKMEQAEALLREACAAADEVEIVDSAPAGPVRVNAPFVDRLSQISGAPRSAKQGWTDVARLGVHGISAVNYGPGETAQAHRADESVELKDLDEVFANLKAALSDGESIVSLPQ